MLFVLKMQSMYIKMLCCVVLTACHSAAEGAEVGQKGHNSSAGAYRPNVLQASHSKECILQAYYCRVEEGLAMLFNLNCAKHYVQVSVVLLPCVHP